MKPFQAPRVVTDGKVPAKNVTGNSILKQFLIQKPSSQVNSSASEVAHEVNDSSIKINKNETSFDVVYWENNSKKKTNIAQDGVMTLNIKVRKLFDFLIYLLRKER